MERNQLVVGYDPAAIQRRRFAVGRKQTAAESSERFHGRKSIPFDFGMRTLTDWVQLNGPGARIWREFYAYLNKLSVTWSTPAGTHTETHVAIKA